MGVTNELLAGHICGPIFEKPDKPGKQKSFKELTACFFGLAYAFIVLCMR